MHQKKTHMKCPECGSNKLRVIPVANMAICVDCGHKWWIDKVNDGYVIVGDWTEVHNKRKTQKKEEESLKLEEKKTEAKAEEAEKVPETKVEVTEKVSESRSEAKPEEKLEVQPEIKEEVAEKVEAPSEVNPQEEMSLQKMEEYNLPPVSFLSTTDIRYKEYKELVDRFVIQRYWIQTAKEVLKEVVSELYDAGALGDNFNPIKVSRDLLNLRDKENGVIEFYGIDWLDRAITKEILARIWLNMEKLREFMRLEKLKYYISVFYPQDLDDFLHGKLSEDKVKKYLYEMEALESGEGT